MNPIEHCLPFPTFESPRWSSWSEKQQSARFNSMTEFLLTNDNIRSLWVWMWWIQIQTWLYMSTLTNVEPTQPRKVFHLGGIEIYARAQPTYLYLVYSPTWTTRPILTLFGNFTKGNEDYTPCLCKHMVSATMKTCVTGDRNSRSDQGENYSFVLVKTFDLFWWVKQPLRYQYDHHTFTYIKSSCR